MTIREEDVDTPTGTSPEGGAEDSLEDTDAPGDVDDETVLADAESDEYDGADEKAESADSDDDSGDDEDEALDELEAEELEMLTDDEASETLVADEAAEMRAIRRAEIAMESEEASGAADDEFVCASCFLVLKRSQLANPRKMICKDCAA